MDCMIDLRKNFGGFGNRLFQLAYVYSQARKGITEDIYLQDLAHFEEFKDEIRVLYGQNVQPIDMVSIHVRRGDYVNNPFYVNLSDTQYYNNAIAEFPKDTKFLVFCSDRQEGSDDAADMEMCKRMFPEPNFEFFRGENEIEDFNAMAGCKAHIIANSSFSWWAAYVGGGKTIAPKAWYTSDKPGIPLPEEWIAL